MFARTRASRIFLVAALYVAAVRLGLTLAFVEQTAVTFWPAAGFALAAPLLWGYGIWPGIFIGQLAADLLIGTQGIGALGTAVGNTASALVGAYALRRISGPDSAFDRLRDMLALLLVAVVSTAISPTIGLVGYGLAGEVPWDRFATLWGVWWVGDVTGALVVAPGILVWARQRLPDLRGRAGVEFAVLATTLVAALLIAFGGIGPLASAEYALAYLAVPYVIWAVLRFGPHGAVTTIVIVAVVAGWQTTYGQGPFSHATVLESMLYLQAFVGVLAIGSHVLAATIVERERAESELRFQKSLLQAQNEGAIDGIVVIGEDGQIRTWNHRFVGIWELPQDPTRLSADACLAHMCARVEDPESFLGRIAQLNANPDERGGGEVVLGDGRTFEWYGTPIFGLDGARYGRGWFYRDITERRRLEEQLRQAQKMEAVGRLAGGIAHDFNNLLTAIQGHARLLLDDLGPEHPVREDLQEIQGAAMRAASLTRQLLAFSRKQVFQPKVLDLNTVVTETARLLKRLIGEDIELLSPLDPGLGRVRADPGQLQQVILNLALNSRDAMPTGGRLTIATANVAPDEDPRGADAGAWPGGWVVLAVSDTGCGMPADVRERIFEPFFTTKEPGKGTGLGLSTVYGIVQQSDGRIQVDSEVGQGTVVRIYLPRVTIAPEAPEPPRAPRRLTGDGQTILLVEDDDVVRALTRRVLERAGYRILEAGNAVEAIDRFSARAPEIDLLLTDVIMPGMSGRELAQQLRAARPELGVVYMSGYTEDEIIHHGGVRGDVTLIAKPFTPDGLSQVIHDALGVRSNPPHGAGRA